MFYTGIVCLDYKYLNGTPKLFATSQYDNIRQACRDIVKILISNGKINYDTYCDSNADEISDDFTEEMFTNMILSQVDDEKDLEIVCLKYGDTYLNENWCYEIKKSET
jgi:hypothetical protein